MEGPVLFVLGAGFYTPENKLSDHVLSDLGLSAPAGNVAVSDRRSVLPIELIKGEKNRDLVRAIKESIISCSEMGERAAMQALERAQVSVEQIGLVIADCATPIETTPAESQRVAGRLGLKVPAYDIYSTNGICPAHFSLISKWKKERVADYVLCVSTNAPTQRVDYSKGSEAWTFSDGASACVVSLKEAPGLEILWSDYQVDASQIGVHSIDTLGYLVRGEANPDAVRVQFKKVVAGIEANQQRWDGKKLDAVCMAVEESQLFSEFTKESALSDTFYNSIADYGHMFGTNSMAYIGAHWDSFSDGQLLSVIVAQGLPGFGAAVFRVRK